MNDTITPERARIALEQEKQQRAEECAQLIKQALEVKRCVLDFSILVNSRGNIPEIKIIALD